MTRLAAPYSTTYLRDVGFPLLMLLMSVWVPFPLIVILFIVSGHAHFAMAYWYQYRSGKMDVRYILVAVTLALCALAYFTFSGELLPLLLAIGILFSAHFAYDEITLHGEPRTRANLIAMLGFTLYFACLVATFAFPELGIAAPYAVLIPAAAFGVRLFITQEAPSRTEWYIWFVEIIIGAVMVLTGNPSSALAAIVLLHAANWYVGYDSKLHSSAERRKKYWIEVFLWLLAMTLLFIIFVYTHLFVLETLFRVRYYYAWAIAHIVLSYMASVSRTSGKASLT